MRSCLTLRAVGLPSMQSLIDSAEVRRNRRTLRCISISSSVSQMICPSKAARVLETAKCRKARALVEGPPPRPGISADRGDISQREASIKCRSLDLAVGRASRGPVITPGRCEAGQPPCLISKMIQISIHAVPCTPRALGSRTRECQKSRRRPQKTSCWAHLEGHRGPCPSEKGVAPAAPSHPGARRRITTGTGINMRFLPKMVGWRGASLCLATSSPFCTSLATLMNSWASSRRNLM